MGKMTEMEFLESVTHTYITSESPQDRCIKSLAMRAFAPFIDRQGTALELGCSDGYFTSMIEAVCPRLTVVDGSAHWIARARSKVSTDVRFVHALFEDYAPRETYDNVFASYILEHVEDAVGLLRHIRGLLSPRGRLFLVVPNARALSRQLARHMNLLADLFELTENDINHGHRRVYDRVLLNRDVEAAGLTQISQGGLMLKPFADFQMDQLMEQGVVADAQIDGLYKLGLEYPDLAGSLFAVCAR